MRFSGEAFLSFRFDFKGSSLDVMVLFEKKK
jgi:hypothetical protein